MESCKTRGIVARRADYGESNCMLTIYAENMGVISACAYGVRSNRSRLKAASQVLCFSEFVLSKKQGDIYRAESAEIIDAFFSVSEDITKLSLANYMLELVRDVLTAEDNAPLRLLLNTLYALAYRELNPLAAKAVFELKLAQYSGYEPMLDACMSCGGADGLCAFDFSGGVKCAACRTGADADIDADLYRALKYIFSAEEKKIFSFKTSEAVLEKLSLLAEEYILNKSERGYRSLEYLKKII